MERDDLIVRGARAVAHVWGENYDNLPEDAGEQGLSSRRGARQLAKAVIDACRLDNAKREDTAEFREGWNAAIAAAADKADLLLNGGKTSAVGNRIRTLTAPSQKKRAR